MLEYWIWLTALPRIGPVTANRLMKKFGNPAELKARLAVKESQLAEAGRVRAELDARIAAAQLKIAEKDAELQKQLAVAAAAAVQLKTLQAESERLAASLKERDAALAKQRQDFESRLSRNNKEKTPADTPASRSACCCASARRFFRDSESWSLTFAAS